MTYAERQKKWIKDNAVIIGTIVRVTRIASLGEDGWGASWIAAMDNFVGQVCQVVYMYTDSNGIVLDNGYAFPYFVLEVVPYNKPEDPVELSISLKEE